MKADSRIAIYGIGPHQAGSTISYSILIKTDKEDSEMIIIHYGHNFGLSSSKNMFTLTLNNGTPWLYIAHNSILKPKQEHNLNDNLWHEISVSMTRESCLLSEVKMYIDGDIIQTRTDQDENIFFTTSGRLSIGGFGYSHYDYELEFPNMSPFIGKVDEFYMWGRPITDDDLTEMTL